MANENESLTYSSRVREVAKKKDLRVSGEFEERLNKKVEELIVEAGERAKENGRSTLKPQDL